MNDVVEAEGLRAGELVDGSPPTKLEIAKQWLLRALPVVNLDTLAVIAVGKEPSTVYLAGPPDLNALAGVFQKISASRGGPNLEAASESVLEILEAIPGRQANIVFVTDRQAFGAPLAAFMKRQIDAIQLTTIVVAPAYGSFNVKKRSEGPSRVFAVRSVRAFTSTFQHAACVHERSADARRIDMAAGAPARTDNSSHALVGVIAVLAAIVGLAAAVAGYFTTLIDKPSTAIPIAGASLGLIAASMLLYVFFAQDVSVAGLYRSTRDAQPYYPKMRRYKKSIRIFALAAAVVCIITSATLLTHALTINNVKPSTEQKPFQSSPDRVR